MLVSIEIAEPDPCDGAVEAVDGLFVNPLQMIDQAAAVEEIGRAATEIALLDAIDEENREVRDFDGNAHLVEQRWHTQAVAAAALDDPGGYGLAHDIAAPVGMNPVAGAENGRNLPAKQERLILLAERHLVARQEQAPWAVRGLATPASDIALKLVKMLFDEYMESMPKPWPEAMKLVNWLPSAELRQTAAYSV